MEQKSTSQGIKQTIEGCAWFIQNGKIHRGLHNTEVKQAYKVAERYNRVWKTLGVTPSFSLYQHRMLTGACTLAQLGYKLCDWKNEGKLDDPRYKGFKILIGYANADKKDAILIDHEYKLSDIYHYCFMLNKNYVYLPIKLFNEHNPTWVQHLEEFVKKTTTRYKKFRIKELNDDITYDATCDLPILNKVLCSFFANAKDVVYSYEYNPQQYIGYKCKLFRGNKACLTIEFSNKF